MNPTQSNDRQRTYVYRGSLPLWLTALLLVPLGFLVLFSLVLAVAGGLVGILFLPLLWNRRRRRAADQRSIELDPSEWRTIDGPPPEETERR